MPASSSSVAQQDDVYRRPRSAASVAPSRRLLRAASYYMKQGLVLTPTKASTTKSAYLPAWASTRLTLSQLAAELDRPGKGIGVILGEVSGGLVDVDLDHPAAVVVADALLPSTQLVSGRTARPRTHRFYRSAGAVTAPYRADATGMIVELRASGCQTVLPPSPHPEGRYHWDSLGEATAVDAALLRRLTGQVAAAAFGLSSTRLSRAPIGGRRVSWLGEVGSLASFQIAQGWLVEHALAFARQPDVDRIAEWERGNDDCPRFRTWLSLQPPQSGYSSPTITPKIDRSAASPYTVAVLDRVGGVVGAARLVGLELREGRQRCPWHDGKGARSLQVTGPLWCCHAGCGSGNAIYLAMQALDLDYRGARNALASLLGIRWQDHAPRRGGGGKRPRRDQPATKDEAHDEATRVRRAEQDPRG